MMFTKAQRQIARILLSRPATASNQEIARQLGLEIETVKRQLMLMSQRSGMDNRVSLAMKIVYDPDLLAEVFELRPRYPQKIDWLVEVAA
jgi:DNA-binding CsgD family transcriptional regulator